MRWRWWWIFTPLILGLITALVILLTDVSNPVLFAQADLWILVLGTGIGLSVLVAVIIAVLDQIEKIQIEDTIQFAEDRRRFLRRLDHELKNPLTAILAGLANLSIAETSKDRSTSLNSVQTQVGRLRRLVAELRKLSELETRPLGGRTEKIIGTGNSPTRPGSHRHDRAIRGFLCISRGPSRSHRTSVVHFDSSRSLAAALDQRGSRPVDPRHPQPPG